MFLSVCDDKLLELPFFQWKWNERVSERANIRRERERVNILKRHEAISRAIEILAVLLLQSNYFEAT